MNQALVEHPEHDVYREQCRRDQERLVGGRFLVRLSGSTKAAVYGHRQSNLPLRICDLLDGLTERIARRQIERDGAGWELALVIDRQRRGRAAESRECTERRLASVRRRHV